MVCDAGAPARAFCVAVLEREALPLSYDPFGPRDPFELVAISLTDDEREVLAYGLISWGGPARCTDALAFAMGFGTYDELLAETARLLPVIRRGDAMSRFDWRRTLFATEIAFAERCHGSRTGLESSVGLRRRRNHPHVASNPTEDHRGVA